MSPDFVPGLVSVIVPTYNRRHLLLESLDSVVAQTYRPIELIVVDDGSIDGTAALVEGWIRGNEPDQRVGLHARLLTQTNSGPSRARNRGLAASRGEFIQFHDSDDILHPRKLEIQVDRLQCGRALGYAYSSAVSFSGRPNWMDRPIFGTPGSMDVARHLAGDDVLLAPSALYRRSTCLAIGAWHEGLSVHEDLEYNFRMLIGDIKGAFVEGNYLAYRQHVGLRLTDLTRSRAPLEQFPILFDSVYYLGAGNAGVMEALAARCFRLGLQAMCLGDYDTAREAVRRGLGCAGSWTRAWKLRMLAVLLAPIVPEICRRRGAEKITALAARKGKWLWSAERWLVVP